MGLKCLISLIIGLRYSNVGKADLALEALDDLLFDTYNCISIRISSLFRPTVLFAGAGRLNIVKQWTADGYSYITTATDRNHTRCSVSTKLPVVFVFSLSFFFFFCVCSLLFFFFPSLRVLWKSSVIGYNLILPSGVCLLKLMWFLTTSKALLRPRRRRILQKTWPLASWFSSAILVLHC